MLDLAPTIKNRELKDKRESCARYLNQLVLDWIIDNDKWIKMFDKINLMWTNKLDSLHKALMIKEFSKAEIINEIRYKVLLAHTKWELSNAIDLTRTHNTFLLNVCVDTTLTINKLLWRK